MFVGGERGSGEVAVGDDEVADAVGGEDDAEAALGEGIVGGVGAVALDEDELVVGEAAGAGVAEEEGEREGWEDEFMGAFHWANSLESGCWLRVAGCWLWMALSCAVVQGCGAKM